MAQEAGREAEVGGPALGDVIEQQERPEAEDEQGTPFFGGRLLVLAAMGGGGAGGPFPSVLPGRGSARRGGSSAGEQFFGSATCHVRRAELSGVTGQ